MVKIKLFYIDTFSSAPIELYIYNNKSQFSQKMLCLNHIQLAMYRQINIIIFVTRVHKKIE